jgi:hypothetical protein
MSTKKRTFIKAVEVSTSDAYLKLTTINTSGERRTITVPQTASNPRSLLGCSVNFAFKEGEKTQAVAMHIEPEVRAYFPPEELDFFSPEDENLDRIKNVHTCIVGKGQLLPEPFTAAGVVLDSGQVVGFEPGTNLTPLLEQTCLWTIGEESETHAIAELLPEHWWIEQIKEHSNGVDIKLWNGEKHTTAHAFGIAELRKRWDVPQITSDLIGEAVSAEGKLLYGRRRGVPEPYFSVQTLCLSPDTLWHYAKVVDDNHVSFWGKTWKLKEPLDSTGVESIIVSPADLVLEDV